jgi:hypothetical protein
VIQASLLTYTEIFPLTQANVFDSFEHLGGVQVAVPVGPARFELRRVTLAPGATLPPSPSGTVRLVCVETRYVGYPTTGDDGSVINQKAVPLDLLVLTVTPATGATPTG